MINLFIEYLLYNQCENLQINKILKNFEEFRIRLNIPKMSYHTISYHEIEFILMISQAYYGVLSY